METNSADEKLMENLFLSDEKNDTFLEHMNDKMNN